MADQKDLDSVKGDQSLPQWFRDWSQLDRDKTIAAVVGSSTWNETFGQGSSSDNSLRAAKLWDTITNRTDRIDLDDLKNRLATPDGKALSDAFDRRYTTARNQKLNGTTSLGAVSPAQPPAPARPSSPGKPPTSLAGSSPSGWGLGGSGGFGRSLTEEEYADLVARNGMQFDFGMIQVLNFPEFPFNPLGGLGNTASDRERQFVRYEALRKRFPEEMRRLGVILDKAAPWGPGLSNPDVWVRILDPNLSTTELRALHKEATDHIKTMRARLSAADQRAMACEIAELLDPTPISGTAAGVDLIQDGQPVLGAVVIGVSWIPFLGPRIGRGLKALARPRRTLGEAAHVAPRGGARAGEGLLPGAAADSRSVWSSAAGDVSVAGDSLPGATGVVVPRRLTPAEMQALQNTHDVEFALIYELGPGPGGRGGRYLLFSGADRTSVWFPPNGNYIWISHSHPAGYPLRASLNDQNWLRLMQQNGSPQNTSLIAPLDDAPFRFSPTQRRLPDNYRRNP